MCQALAMLIKTLVRRTPLWDKIETKACQLEATNTEVQAVESEEEQVQESQVVILTRAKEDNTNKIIKELKEEQGPHLVIIIIIMEEPSISYPLYKIEQVANYQIILVQVLEEVHIMEVIQEDIAVTIQVQED